MIMFEVSSHDSLLENENENETRPSSFSTKLVNERWSDHRNLVWVLDLTIDIIIIREDASYIARDINSFVSVAFDLICTVHDSSWLLSWENRKNKLDPLSSLVLYSFIPRRITNILPLLLSRFRTPCALSISCVIKINHPCSKSREPDIFRILFWFWSPSFVWNDKHSWKDTK